METVWRVQVILFMEFYGQIGLKIENMVNQITKQSPY